MTWQREQAINYLKSSGMSDEQIESVESGFLSVLEDIKEELSHIDKPEPHNIGYESGVYDGVQLAITTIDKHISGKEKSDEDSD